MASILIVEDDPAQRAALQEYLEGLKLPGGETEVYAAADGELARAVLKERPLDIIICDLMLPDTTAIELVKELRAKDNRLPFLILTGQPSIETAIEAIRQGASDYMLKPVDLVLLGRKIAAFFETARLREENRNLRIRLQESFHAENMIGNSPALKKVLEKVRQVATTDVMVLLEGESGTGKDLIANLIHNNSERSGRPFIKVNCGALTRTLLESELFGVSRGAYTGADRDRVGYFESANGGSIFLDEIGEMSLESQVHLLRTLEDHKVVRVGSTREIAVDVRIIAATNKEFMKEVEKQNFREDLYYRLAVIKFSLPPLRERRDDIPLLFNHFVIQFNERYHKSVTGLSPQLLSFFQSYHWPGNIREFRNVLEGMVVLAKEDILDMDELPADMQNVSRRGSNRQKLEDGVIPAVPLANYENAIIARNLAFFHGNREKTANALGISARTLYRKIHEYDL